MAGGATTPALAAAVTAAGGVGVLAAGYLSAAQLRDLIAATRDLTSGPFGVNLFVPWPARPVDAAVAAYASRIKPDADRLGVQLGEPRWDDDDWPAKLALLLADPVPLVSLTFGAPA
jgi:nitronate monooxygenase